MTEDHAAEPPEEVAAVPEKVISEADAAAEKASALTAGEVEQLLVKHISPLSDRVLALEQKGEAVVTAPPAAVERAAVEAEPPLVRPKRKHWTASLPRGLF